MEDFGYLPKLILYLFLVVATWIGTFYIQVYGMANGWGYWNLLAFYAFPLTFSAYISRFYRERSVSETEYIPLSIEETQANINYLETMKKRVASQ